MWSYKMYSYTTDKSAMCKHVQQPPLNWQFFIFHCLSKHLLAQALILCSTHSAPLLTVFNSQTVFECYCVPTTCPALLMKPVWENLDGHLRKLPKAHLLIGMDFNFPGWDWQTTTPTLKSWAPSPGLHHDLISWYRNPLERITPWICTGWTAHSSSPGQKSYQVSQITTSHTASSGTSSRLPFKKQPKNTSHTRQQQPALGYSRNPQTHPQERSSLQKDEEDWFREAESWGKEPAPHRPETAMTELLEIHEQHLHWRECEQPDYEEQVILELHEAPKIFKRQPLAMARGTQKNSCRRLACMTVTSQPWRTSRSPSR